MDSASSFASIGSSVSTLTAVACDVGIIWIVATVVKRHRPDAYRPLLAWAIASLMTLIVFFFAYPAAAALRVDSGAEGYVFAIGVLGFARAGVSIVLVLLLIRGLVALAQPPKPVVVSSDAPYR